jgi:anthranilate phosphoribosyltransferase
MSFKHYLTKLVSRENLTVDEAEAAVDSMLSSSSPSTAPDPAAIGAFLALLRAKGESPSEIAGMVKAMYKACIPVHLPGMKLLDIVGTGGDGADTINISTASIILASACGCLCSKAGNRSVSSLCGSADVLEALGVVIDLSPQQTARCIESCGLGFMFAPINHPAMKQVAPVRKSLGIRTAFNLLGELNRLCYAKDTIRYLDDSRTINKCCESSTCCHWCI